MNSIKSLFVVGLLFATMGVLSAQERNESQADSVSSNKKNWALPRSYNRIYYGFSVLNMNQRSRGGINVGMMYAHRLINAKSPLFFHFACELNWNYHNQSSVVNYLDFEIPLNSFDYHKKNYDANFVSFSVPTSFAYDIRISQRFYLETSVGVNWRLVMEGKLNEKRLSPDGFGVFGYNCSTGLVFRKCSVHYRYLLEKKDYFYPHKARAEYNFLTFAYWM